jgi:predicted tellurium resistance membrane protein TerC/Mg2+/Co2+ transporter CorC
MEWMSDPAIWVGFLTLVVLEIVLGIDNLIFIAILSDKLPASQRANARRLGLGLALIMRLGLLMSISWIASLTAPVFTALGMEISWRDIVLIAGGGFLLIKATIEIHDRIEVLDGEPAQQRGHARFWPTIAQIVVLDAVFSIDSVITAVGMVDELPIMIAAVVIAVIAMITAAGPLTRFINTHPTLVILCLGFLLMVGLVLVVDGFGYHIPKGYLYAAIAFSVLIEIFNQLAQRRRRRLVLSLSLRHRTADAILRLLGGVPLRAAAVGPADIATFTSPEESSKAFAPAEHAMVRGVLSLAERSVRTIMTPRTRVQWIDATATRPAVLAALRRSPHRVLLLGRGSIEEVIGIVRKEDVLELALSDRPFDLAPLTQEPVAIPGSSTVLAAFDAFRNAPIEMAIVVDEYGSLLGIVTRADLLQAIAGHLPDTADEQPEARQLAGGAVSLDAGMPMFDVQQQLGIEALPPEAPETLAGLVLERLGRVPQIGDQVRWGDWILEVAEMQGWRIARVIARRAGPV